MTYIEKYCKYFGYDYDEFIPSELSGQQANDIHHIRYRSQQGDDSIDNLIALTREEHNKAHFISGKLTADYLQDKHNQFKKRYDENRSGR